MRLAQVEEQVDALDEGFVGGSQYLEGVMAPDGDLTA